jgi:hypothetical protein
MRNLFQTVTKVIIGIGILVGMLMGLAPKSEAWVQDTVKQIDEALATCNRITLDSNQWDDTAVFSAFTKKDRILLFQG